jgi:hypothetical protein
MRTGVSRIMLIPEAQVRTKIQECLDEVEVVGRRNEELLSEVGRLKPLEKEVAHLRKNQWTEADATEMAVLRRIEAEIRKVEHPFTTHRYDAKELNWLLNQLTLLRMP